MIYLHCSVSFIQYTGSCTGLSSKSCQQICPTSLLCWAVPLQHCHFPYLLFFTPFQPQLSSDETLIMIPEMNPKCFNTLNKLSPGRKSREKLIFIKSGKAFSLVFQAIQSASSCEHHHVHSYFKQNSLQ